LKEKPKKSALHEKAGISPPEILSANVAENIQQFRKQQPTSKELVDEYHCFEQGNYAGGKHQ
jgi:LAO/AO transport system kinase